MNATFIKEAATKALVKIPQGVTIRLNTQHFGQLESNSVLWAMLCGDLRDKIGFLSKEEEAEFYKGLEVVERFFYKTLQSRFDEMYTGDEAKFSAYTFWGNEHSDVLENGRRLITEDLKRDFDWERDILFVFKWDDRPELLSRIIYRVPTEVLATKKHQKELEELHEEVIKMDKKKLYRVKVWEADKDFDVEYDGVEEVHWDAVNKVVTLKYSDAVFYICAKKVCVWES